MGLLHWFQMTFGFRKGSGDSPEYLFWSGAGSDLAYIGVLWGGIALYRKHNCQVKHCPRIGKFKFDDPDAGVERLLCWRHHPNIDTKQLTRAKLHLYLGSKPGKG